MAKLCDLASCFMEAFLKTNPNSLVDSNGYLRSEYEAELARRKQPVAEPSGVPDPRTYRPQFECTGEVEPVFESPEAQLGIADIKQLIKQLIDEGYLTQEQMEAILTAPLLLTVIPAPPLEEGQPRIRIVDAPSSGVPDPSAQCDQQTAARNDETLEVKEDFAADTVYMSEHETVEPQVAQQETLSETDASQTEPVEYVYTTAYELYEWEQSVPAEDVNPAPEPETQASNLTTEAPPDEIGGEIKASAQVITDAEAKALVDYARRTA